MQGAEMGRLEADPAEGLMSAVDVARQLLEACPSLRLFESFMFGSSLRGVAKALPTPISSSAMLVSTIDVLSITCIRNSRPTTSTVKPAAIISDGDTLRATIATSGWTSSALRSKVRTRAPSGARQRIG